MAFLGFLAFLIPVVAIGGFLLFIIAMINEKGPSRGAAIRSAFLHVVAVILLGLVISSSVFLVRETLKSTVLKHADSNTYSYRAQPPLIFLSATTSPNTSYSCTDACQFSQTDKDQLASWRDSYNAWKKESTTPGSYASDSRKRDIASAASFLIVSLPLFIWFFGYMIQADWKRQKASGHRPGPLRLSYYYFISLIGLIGLVVSGAMLINIGLKSALGVPGNSTTYPVPVTAGNYDTAGVNSIINCTSACGFTDDDKKLAQQWLVDYESWQKGTGAGNDQNQTDLANLIPTLLAAAPLFFYHFLTIRRESKDDHDLPATPPAAAST